MSTTSTQPLPLLMSDRQAGRRLGVGRTTVRKLMAEGKLQSLTIGRRRLITEASLQACLASALKASTVTSDGQSDAYQAKETQDSSVADSDLPTHVSRVARGA